ncbi:hydrolase of the alpha/beta-hydrolase fold family [Legionella beliardensis]|uniref:Hydrolase of the alpha/beta-hydrolase fold family n=1 Tax=Legionella beliardensis TaxID=91822 RepID=A0A378HYV8_9GAMM|nr:hydrolase [Legionella beliardensis]STX28098.1 hydrolase of the alpha/beta-hydrolase fold family [Legionella beliardensis]
MIINSSFKPAWWLPSAHTQTIYPTLARKVKAPVDKIERVELLDGDFVDLAWASNGLPTDAPLVILLHGLGGSMQSPYAGGLMQALNNCGWRAVLMHFRGSSGEPNRLARAYHSGDTMDFDFIVKRLAQAEPHSLKAAIGISLGGNVLLKWLGESGKQDLLVTAVAVSVPFQLRLVADRINQGFSRVYQNHLLRRLQHVFGNKRAILTNNLPEALQNIEKWRCFWTFDEHVTAPLHGFANVHDYYRKASSYNYLPNILTPTLIIHAQDDPFMTPEVIPSAEQLPDCVTLELSKKGGHVGFISGNTPGKPIYWLDERIPDYLKLFFTSTTV